MTNGTSLETGKTYRLVRAGASYGAKGLVFTVLSDYGTRVTKMDLYRPRRWGRDEMWWKYENDIFEELSDEEAVLYKPS